MFVVLLPPSCAQVYGTVPNHKHLQQCRPEEEWLHMCVSAAMPICQGQMPWGGEWQNVFLMMTS